MDFHLHFRVLKYRGMFRRRLETKYKKRKCMRVFDMHINVCDDLNSYIPCTLYLILVIHCAFSAFTTGCGEETCLCTPCLSSLAYRECASSEEISFERCKMIYGAPSHLFLSNRPVERDAGRPRFGRQNFRGDECRTCSKLRTHRKGVA